jgi:hypothetical protein
MANTSATSSTGGFAVRRSRTRRRYAPWVALGLLLVVSVPAGHWYLTTRSLAWQVRRGLQLLESADTATKVREALDRWESETARNWAPRRDEFITHLFKGYPLADARVRLLLTWVAGADYGPRPSDWKRWYENHRRLADGLPPKVPRREAVGLKWLWEAPVGLTTWFTTILPLDGQIYVASLGSEFHDAEDQADGVVRVDGRTGTAELLFSPPLPQRGPRDVIGLAAGDDGLFVACSNGSVYLIDPEGQMRWHVHAGDPIVGPPLATDINHDGTTDAVVVTRATKATSAKAVALSGRGGKTLWATTVAKPPASETLLGATLALGRLLPDASPELLVTLPNGDVAVLNPRTGDLRRQQELPGGTIAGAICRPTLPDAGPAAYLGDRSAGVWSLIAAGRKLEFVPWQALAIRRDETLIAALRTAALDPRQPPLIIVCPTGDYTRQRGTVCALEPDGVRWRLPIGGALWGTPAVADLTGDGLPELIVASIEPRPDGRAVGVLTIVSAAGHVLQRVELDAPVECSPVVADVNGDGRLEVLVADQAGRLHCYATPGYGPVEWGLFGGDSHNTRNATNAYAFGQVLFGRQWQWKPE